MAAYVGPQYSADQLWEHYRHYCGYELDPDEEMSLRPLAKRIRAFDVPRLKSGTFIADRLGGVVPALQALLLERLSGIFWDFADIGSSFEAVKYHIIHIITSAPMDETSREPMVLEIYGGLTQLKGAVPHMRQMMKWFEALTPDEKANLDDIMIGKMTFQIERASYANTAVPGIGVPFYL
jgi:hypothetical protein